MTQCFVIVKGSIKDAVLAANQRAIILHAMKHHKPSQFGVGEVHAFVDAECLPELVQWFVDDGEAADYEPGTLLWYSEPRSFGNRTLHSFNGKAA
jgi:hypothetical protein